MIVPLNENHVAQVAALECECFSDPWSEASVRYECENPISTWFAEEREGRVAGYIGAQSVPPEADVMNLAVAPEYRRQGIGRALLRHLEEALHRDGIETLFLEVRASNEPARRLYEASDYRVAGVRKKYYVNPTEDALIMKKELKEC